MATSYSGDVSTGSFRCAVLLSPFLPGWAKQLPALFEAPLRTPSFIGWSESDKMLLHEPTGAAGPTECAKLWADAACTVRCHAGPGHRPMPKDPAERAAFVREIADLIKYRCPE